MTNASKDTAAAVSKAVKVGLAEPPLNATMTIATKAIRNCMRFYIKKITGEKRWWYMTMF